MQNILVLIVKAEHAGAILMQCFEDVKMSISCSKVEGSASLNTFWVAAVLIKRNLTCMSLVSILPEDPSLSFRC